MAERPGYWERRRIVRDYYRKCRKGKRGHTMSGLRKVISSLRREG